MTTAIHRRVRALRAGQDPTFIARLASGWAVMGDPQVLPGYCLLLPDPVVPHLNAMPPDAQVAFLGEGHPASHIHSVWRDPQADFALAARRG